MTFKSYIKPETEHVVLNINQAVLDVVIGPDYSTEQMLGNEGHFEEEDDEYDEFLDDF